MTQAELDAMSWAPNMRCVWSGHEFIALHAVAFSDQPEGEGFTEAQAAKNGLFAAHARSDVPALLAEVQRLRGLVEAAYKEGVEQGHSFPWDESNAKRLLDGGTE